MSGINTTRRSVLGGMAIATAAIGTAAPSVATSVASDPAFDEALREYHRLRAADVHDSKHGDLRAAYDRFDAQVQAREAAYGTKDKAAYSAADQEQAERDWKAVTTAEEVHCDRFSVPRWEAFAVFAALAAPSVAALHTKVETAMEEDGNLEGIAEHIRADLRRFAGKGAGS